MPKMLNEYRCTRPDQYPPGCPGHTDPSARQGYYITALTMNDAARIMTSKFPSERVDIRADPWKVGAREARESDIPEFLALVTLAGEMQNACNMGALVHTYSSKIIPALWEINNNYDMGGTGWVNSNQVTRLVNNKLVSLSGDVKTTDWPDGL